MAQDAWDRIGDVVLSATRIVVSFLFVLHGAAALFGVLGAGAPTPVGLWPGWWAGLIQFVCGGLVLIGLGTRPAALISSGAMAFAYFTVHQPRGLFPMQNYGELAALYSWFFLLFAALGAGPFSIDALLHRGRKARTGSSVDAG
ncbi:DoxX family protein [Saccharopolyspora sp. NPDC002686]|uniref:DoxX family protein n=1 Tax=Saccharopolyspora sp. NPDC002686 TaxID=3154541 RepID=UPI0033218EA1